MITRVLIIRFSSIGDIVLTTPVIRCLKQQIDGDPEIHFLTKRQYAPVLEANPYLSKIHVIDSSVSEVTGELKDEGFDYIIDLHNNLRSSLVKRSLKMLSFTFDKLNFRKWLLVNFKVNRLPEIHVVDRYMDTLKAFGIQNDGKGLDYFIPEKDEVDLSALPESHRSGYIAFAIGAKHATKCLPDEKIISICRKLGKPVLLLGGEEDREKGKKISAMAGEWVVNACGNYNINQSASLVEQADKVITHDTGLMHIAAAFKKDIVSVWGNTVPAFGMYPYLPGGAGKSTVVEVKQLSCRPCTKLGHEKCPKKHFYCMNLIDEDEIVEAVS